MGACVSKIGGSGTILTETDGGEEEYHARFIEDRVLGEGEFGVVTMVHDLTKKRENKLSASQNGNANGNEPDGRSGKIFFENDTVGCDFDDSSMACKTLRKGVVFKYNTVYAPLKPEVLRREVDILQQLDGKNFCLGFHAVYETSRVIYLVTELCTGGDMFQYLSKREADLRTDEVSRISYQLLSAVDHCAKNNVINRDIKPENIMFTSTAHDSELRLIDFGSGTNKVTDGMHTTFAGTAFYISPEMFQNTYTQKTDVWSTGVCLYVLVAGYPSKVLQTAFNMMHGITPGERNLRKLPNMPETLPDSYFKMLKDLLEYKHKKRKTAGQVLQKSDFVRFHKFAHAVEHSSVIGSVGRHALHLDYQKFERSLTTLLATMLSKFELALLVETIQLELEEQMKKEEEKKKLSGEEKEETIETSHNMPVLEDTNKSLDVVDIRRVMELLHESEHDQVIAMIEKLPGYDSYDTHAYNIVVLKYFVGASSKAGRERQGDAKKKKRKTKTLSGTSVFGKMKYNIDSSLHSISGRIRTSVLDWSAHSTNSGMAKNRASSADGSNHSYNAKKAALLFGDKAQAAAPVI